MNHRIDETSLSFTTTAMPRPELVRKVYESFTQNLAGLNLKQVALYINIDRSPNDRSRWWINIMTAIHCLEVSAGMESKVMKE